MITNIKAPYSLYNYSIVYGTSNRPQKENGDYLGPHIKVWVRLVV